MAEAGITGGSVMEDGVAVFPAQEHEGPAAGPHPREPAARSHVP